MDDILLACVDESLVQLAAKDLVAHLQTRGFRISEDKIQIHPPQLFLGFELLPNQVKTQKSQIRTQHLKTLNDFQRLLGDITWLRPYLKVPTGALKPLFDILKGDSNPNSSRQLTPEVQKAMAIVDMAIQDQFIAYYDASQPLLLIICPTTFAPTAVL